MTSLQVKICMATLNLSLTFEFVMQCWICYPNLLSNIADILKNESNFMKWIKALKNKSILFSFSIELKVYL